MAKSKTPTSQELYQLRKQREERERTAYLPPGLINHGNTCFMNSVLQGLIATRLLADLVHFNPIPPELQQTSSTLIMSKRSPQLTNGHNLAGNYEQPWVNSMPIGDMFLTVLYKAWDMQGARRREILSPKPILGALGQKYEQYLDFAQQDAHEFLRILLDAMRMEEQDIIKKRQPPPPPPNHHHHHHKKRRRTTLTPANSRDPDTSDLHSDTTDHTNVPSTSACSNENVPTNDAAEQPVPLMSFADMIFGGHLTSILVCQKCKHISQTYEEFNDISLSIKPEDYFSHNRKRDRFKKIVGRLTAFPGSGSSSNHHGHHGHKHWHSTKESSSAQASENQPMHLPVPHHAMEIQRSSSVPPSPRAEMDRSQYAGGGHEELPLEAPRRRSLDVLVGGVGSAAPDQPKPVIEDPVPVESQAPDVAVEEKDMEDDGTLESDGSHVIVNVTGPEGKHVEFVEPKIDRKAREDSLAEKESPKVKETEFTGGKEEGKEGKEKEEGRTHKHDNAGWAKLGRRISLTVGLGRPRGADKDKERKSTSMDHSLLLGGAVKGGVVANMIMQKSFSAGMGVGSTSSMLSEQDVAKSRMSSDGSARSSPVSMAPEPSIASSSTVGSSSSSYNRIFKPLPPRPTPSSTSIPLLRRSPSPQPSSSQHLSANTSQAPSPVIPILYVQSSKSPKPPKPTAAEAEYLRKILADISSSSSSASPFAIFKPPLLHSHSFHHHYALAPILAAGSSSTTSGPSVGGAGSERTVWLGMEFRNFSGIEECLRMFTAVEVLDGENMVGCRRCWKIQNGVYQTSKRHDDGVQDDSDQEEYEEEEEVSPAPSIGVDETPAAVNGFDKQESLSKNRTKPPLTVPAPSIDTANAMHIPTSISAPLVSFYEQGNSSITRSVSSLPATVSQVNLGMSNGSTGNNSSVGDSLSLFAISESSTKVSSETSVLPHGPGGLPIPVISTTAPLDTPVDSTTSVDSDYSTGAESLEQAQNTNRESAYARLTGNENGIQSTSTSPPLPSVASPNPMYGYNRSSGSKDSLVIPQSGKPRYQRRKTSYSDTTTEDNDSSGDDSDTSVGTSMSADSVTSGSRASSSQQHQANGQANPSPSGSPKPPPIVPAAEPSSSQPESSQTQVAKSPAPQKKPSKPKPVIMRPAYKRYLIATPPPVLVIHLKRFQQTSRTPLMSFSHGFKKLEDYVSFPEYLDLMPFLAPKKEDYGLGKKGKGRGKEKKGKSAEEKCMYRLYAVVVHIGNMLGGHYVAYTALPEDSPLRSRVDTSNSTANVSSGTTAAADDAATEKEKDSSKGSAAPESSSSSSSKQPTKPRERQWAYVSDTVVRLTTLEEVLHAKAYICMYERC